MGEGHAALEVIFLGTGATCPTRERALPSALVQVVGYRYLVDCGEGTQRQLLACGLGLKAPDAILLTHTHLDHVLGLPGYLSTLARLGHDSSIPVYVPQASMAVLDSLLTSAGTRGMVDVREAAGIIATIPGGTVSGFELEHSGIACVGYLFSLDGRWHLDADALDRFAVPAGPLRKELAEGSQIVLPDGRRVAPEQVRSSFAPAVRLAFAGDSSSWGQLANQVGGVDMLVGEATYLRRDESLARRNGHLTAEQLAMAARQAGVRWLVATHLSQRYGSEEYLEELQEVFPQSVVAEDFLSVRLTHAGELVQAPYHKVRPPGCG